jgi:hypothetical protein
MLWVPWSDIFLIAHVWTDVKTGNKIESLYDHLERVSDQFLSAIIEEYNAKLEMGESLKPTV